MGRQIDVETPPSLLLRIRDHDDAEAWRAFAEVYSPLIYGFCRLRGMQSSDAADVTQEVLIRVARAIRGFEYDRRRGLFRDWLATIVYNEMRRHLTRRRETEGSDALEQILSEGAAAEWQDHFQQHIFETALKRSRPHFAEQTWRLFDASWLQRVAVAELAEREQVSVDQIYVARSRVLKRLKREITVLVDDAI